MSAGRKRVLVVDDSVFARRIVSDIISSSVHLQVVGTAVNGRDALDQFRRLKPDVVTLDIEMPEMDGLEVLRTIMRERPTPVVILSSLTTRGARESFAALGLGAVDVMAKPHGSHSIGLAQQADELIAKVVAAAGVDTASLRVPSAPRVAPARPANVRWSSAPPVVIIASSTGGPRALRTLVPQLSNEYGAAYVIIQHLPEGFSGPMAQDLNALTSLEVRETSDGDQVQSGHVLVARSGFHCVIEHGGRIRLAKTAPMWGVRPAADVTMASAVPVYGSRLVGVVLTGMGCDGTEGLRMIKQAGGATIAEHESSCVIYGMPRSVVEAGVVDATAPIDRVGAAIDKACARVSGQRAHKAA
jgi:two-component system chemotaxis response regulator CheB